MTSLTPRPRWFLMCVILRALVVLCQSLKNICTILGCLSDRLTSLEKGQSESPVPNSKTSGGTARGSEIPTGTDVARGGCINRDSARSESQTDSDDESNSCVEIRDADETTDDPDSSRRRSTSWRKSRTGCSRKTRNYRKRAIHSSTF